MDTLASIDVLDFNNSATPTAYRVDGVYAEPAIANEPRHDPLSHSGTTFSVGVIGVC